MRQPKVSAIICVYNQAGFVRETVDSVLAQTYPNIEIIITDDGSTDGTQEIIREYAGKYPGRVVPILSEKNTGLSANENRGLSAVSGEYIAWLGGDDLMLPLKIEKQVALLESRPDAVGCCHDAEVFESSTGKVLGLVSEVYNGTRGLKEGGVELWFDTRFVMFPSSMMVRRSAMPPEGRDVRLRHAGEWLTDISVFRQGRCVVLNEVLGRYRRHSANISGTSSVRNTGLEETLVVFSIVDAKFPELHDHVRRRRNTAYLVEAAKMYTSGDVARSNAYLRIAGREGALVKSMGMFVALRLFGNYFSDTISLQAHKRPRWFTRLAKIVLH